MRARREGSTTARWAQPRQALPARRCGLPTRAREPGLAERSTAGPPLAPVEPRARATPGAAGTAGAPHDGAAAAGAGALGAGGLQAGAGEAAGAPHDGAGDPGGGFDTAGDAGAPHPPAAGGAGAGAPQPEFAFGATMVGATAACLGWAGGAQVAATPAVWLAG